MFHLSQFGTHFHQLSHEIRKSQKHENISSSFAEDSDQEFEKEIKKDEDSSEEYVFISALTGSVSLWNDTWIVDSGDSKHMKGYKDSLSCLVQKESPHKVMFGDDSQHPIKGTREASYKLDSGKSMKMKDVLYVPGTKEKSSFYFCITQERLQSCLCGWKSSHVDKRKNHR